MTAVPQDLSVDPPAPPADPRRWRALAVLLLVQFMLILDVSVVNIALPAIQRDLGFTRAGLTWVVDSYVLMAGSLLLLGGRLGDVLGRRRLFLVGVAVFGVASVACGLAPSASRAGRRSGSCAGGPTATRSAHRARSGRPLAWPGGPAGGTLAGCVPCPC